MIEHTSVIINSFHTVDHVEETLIFGDISNAFSDFELF